MIGAHHPSQFVMNGGATSLTGAQWQFEEILADPNAQQEEDPDDQQLFYALEIESRAGSEAMKLLVAQFQPLTELGFGHLKRMKKHPDQPKKLIALICPMRQPQHDQEQLKQLAARFDHASVCQVSVLKNPPKTKEAFLAHTKQWPLIFHDTTVVNESASEQVHFELFQKHLQNVLSRRPLVHEHTTKSRNRVCCSSVCVIVDPTAIEKDGEVVAHGPSHEEHETTCCEPLVHAVMQAIDAVAQRDRQRESLKRARRDQQLATTTTAAAATTAATTTIQKRKFSAEESYLCTGYDVYLDTEPCTLCAMAMVHSRMRRVIFAHKNPQFGALVSCYRLHTIPSLNHHFRVFCLQDTLTKPHDEEVDVEVEVVEEEAGQGQLIEQ